MLKQYKQKSPIDQAEQAKYLYLPIPVPVDGILNNYQKTFTSEFKEAGFQVLRVLLNKAAEYKILAFNHENLARWSKTSVSTVKRVLKWLRDQGLINWCVEFKKRNVYKISEWFFKKEIRQWFSSFFIANRQIYQSLFLWAKPISHLSFLPKTASRGHELLLILKEFIYLNFRAGSRTSRRLTESDYAALRDSASQTNGTVRDKNSLSKQELEAILSNDPLKQEREYEHTQSSPTFYPRDYRAEPHKVGADKAVRFSPSSDSRCQERAQSQQAGPRSLRTVFQDMFGVLPEEQHRTGMASSGYTQGSIQDAGECDDGVAGYEGDWSEVF